MSRLLGIIVASGFFVFVAAASHAIYDDCDRNYDRRITVTDALIALQNAVSNCVKDHYCDADGDDDETASDALLILQYAAGLPIILECACIAIDECFDDGDCAHYPGSFCLPYRCVECEFDADCAPGFVCDGCSMTCTAARQ